ncbi:MAG TPA: hypothetical protein VHG71_03055 [Verrucomicrobiae bacterium]|nr:hypothetical protein [Verrucomicrobiae bacterium]
MNKTLKIILFGIVSGLIWSLISFHSAFTEPDHQSILPILSIGIATGIAVSFTLKVPLAKCGMLWSLILGLLSFPLGAFIYGFLYMCFSMISEKDFSLITPFVAGFYGALTGVISFFYLFPVAVLTTFILRAVIRSNNLSLKH